MTLEQLIEAYEELFEDYKQRATHFESVGLSDVSNFYGGMSKAYEDVAYELKNCLKSQ